jgi:hypothetical protein
MGKASENKENAGNGSNFIPRVGLALRSPSPDFQRYVDTCVCEWLHDAAPFCIWSAIRIVGTEDCVR